ncbi:MAG TPA: ABC transporter permease [Candidatus Acidoferrales bacterium]|nr:ABC transporter permease [Candidatus Acidoferrales bacterium]
MVPRTKSLLKNLFRRRRTDQQLDDELRGYVELLAEEKRKTGTSAAEALREAKMELGGVEQVKEQVREIRAGHFLESLWQDLRYGLRMLRKSPGFTLVAVLTLALGIGANTAIFSMVDWLVLRPIPGVKDSGQLSFLIAQLKGGGHDNGFSYPNFEDIRNQSTSVFSYVAGVRPFQMDGLHADGKTMQIWTNYVTGDFFEMLGVQPALGRFILPSEGKVAGADPILVLSYSYWQTHFGGDPNVIGKKVAVNGQPVTIIGVAPKGFQGALAILDTQGYLPIGMAGATLAAKGDFLTDRKADSEMILIGRLKPGVSLAAAQPVLKVVAERLSQQYPTTDKWVSLRAARLTAAPPGANADSSQPLLVIAGLFLFLAGMVLLLACVNIANLLLVRAGVRGREMAVRAALGAGRGRLMRQMLTESNLLALLGCAGGIVMGIGCSRALSSLSLGTAIPIVLDFGFNWRVFSYAITAALLTGIIVGFVPAIRASRGNLNEVLHEGGRTATGGKHRMRSTLVVAQVAGSLMLLIVAGLFVRSLQNVQHTDLGFDPSHVLNVSMDPREAGYNGVKGTLFLRDLARRVRGIPGVQSASIAASIPTGLYTYGAELKVTGYEQPANQGPIFAGENAVSPGYFETMNIPLIEGRDFLDSDGANSPHVAIINEAMAKKFWPGLDVVGRQFTIVDDPTHPVQVVGVVKNSVTGDITETIGPYLYLPFAQKYMTPATLQLRTKGAPESMASGVLGIIRSIEPAMPTFDVHTMTQALDTPNGFMLFEMGAGLAGVLGILGLALAIVGVYGVISFAASQRTHEIGIRMALGAQRGQILKMIFRQGLLIVGVGLGLGILAALGISRLVGSLLVGVGAADPLTYMSVSILLAFVALAACYIPARRAMRVDPMVALRYE